jgi:hypothetical protein
MPAVIQPPEGNPKEEITMNLMEQFHIIPLGNSADFNAGFTGNPSTRRTSAIPVPALPTSSALRGLGACRR